MACETAGPGASRQSDKWGEEWGYIQCAQGELGLLMEFELPLRTARLS